MSAYFTIIKYIGRDFFNIDGKLTEDQLKKILLKADYGSFFHISEWNDDSVDPDGTPELIDQKNGEEWLNKHL